MLLQLLSIGALLVVPSLGQLSRTEFESYLDPMCVSTVQERASLVNGQEYPLAQTLENFISLVEKFEHANPNYGLKNELFYFIRNYTYDNIEFSPIGDVTTFEPKESDLNKARDLWERDESARRRLPDAKDPFEDNEKCSLYYMLSHSIIRKSKTPSLERSAAAGNNSRMMNDRPVFNLDDMYPIEIGVVAIRGTEKAVDLGRVLRGMYVGLKEDRKLTVDEISGFPLDKISVDQERTIDPLYTLTIAEVISLVDWRSEIGNRINYPSKEGWWASSDQMTKDICPVLYRLPNGTMSAYSQSSLRGAADGFILGRMSGDIERKHRTVKLSQLLRMYYSRGGLSSNDPELGARWASFCNRDAFLAPLEKNIEEQVRLYQLLVGRSFKSIEDNLKHNMDYYRAQKSSIFGIWNTELDNYCGGKDRSVAEPEVFPVESPLDIIAVLDTSDGPEFYRRQQLIIGHMARKLDLHYSGSRMTVLTDQRDKQAFSSNSNSGTITLQTVVPESYSSACVACSVVQFPKTDEPSLPEDEVIIAINQLLEQKKMNESRKNGADGKVVIYFNFNAEEDSARPSPLQVRVNKALRDLHIRHIDVAMYALGKDPQLVKKYGRNDIAFVLSAVEEAENVIGDKLFMKVTQAPATLQYSDCVDGRGENTAVYEDFVSPNAVQHWSMPAKYFYKSFNLKFTFEANYGPLRVCHSRATISPEEQKDNCKQIDNGQKLEIKHSNPCKSFNEISCSPFYFSVIGLNTTEGAKQDCIDTNMENQCKTLDQIKFRIMHEGIRCNGSSALVAAPIFMVLLALLHNILSKRF